MNFVEIDKLERVQYSYVKLPEGYNMGLFTKMIPGSIPAAEINSTLIGVPPPNSAQAPANTSNPSKQILMEVTIVILTKIERGQSIPCRP